MSDVPQRPPVELPPGSPPAPAPLGADAQKSDAQKPVAQSPSNPAASDASVKAAGAAPLALAPIVSKPKTPVDTGARAALVVTAALSAVLSVAAFASIADLRASGLPGWLGVGLGSLSLSLGLVALVVRRKSPRKLGWPAAAALVGALACASSGLAAVAARAPASTPEQDADPALRAWSVGEAQARARAGATFGAAGMAGAFLGLLGVWLGVRARQRARSAAPPANLGVESVPLGFAALAGLGVLVVGGGGVDAWALGAEVKRIDHPHVAKLRVIRDAVHDGKLDGACEALETSLAPGYVPPDVLERELPGYREIAVRCVTLRIDALPKGLACATEAGKLGATETVRAASAEDRVKHACTNAF